MVQRQQPLLQCKEDQGCDGSRSSRELDINPVPLQPFPFFSQSREPNLPNASLSHLLSVWTCPLKSSSVTPFSRLEKLCIPLSHSLTAEFLLTCHLWGSFQHQTLSSSLQTHHSTWHCFYLQNIPQTNQQTNKLFKITSTPFFFIATPGQNILNPALDLLAFWSFHLVSWTDSESSFLLCIMSNISLAFPVVAPTFEICVHSL